VATIDDGATEFYSDNGYYLLHQPVFPERKFRGLADLFEELLENSTVRPDKLDTPHFGEPRLLEYLLDNKIIDLVETFIGPNIGLWSSHFICKEALRGPSSAWHADSDYWNGRFETFTGIVTLWLAIDASDRGNGCMRVIPGSHKTSGHAYQPVDRETDTFRSEIVDVDESEAVYFELQRNECSFHDSRIVHGAEANTSYRRRCGYTMRYFSQQMKLRMDHPTNKTFKLWHCRGNNPHSNPVVN
jgi:ectoine hydroxylase-related dioxygenase (phytanoyl-CoA dioxygenase family)